MIRCTSCGTENVDGAAFCDNCGTSLGAPAGAAGIPTSVAPAAGPGTSCPACGGAVLPGEAFCETCGVILSAPAPVQAAVSPPISMVPGPSAPTPFAAPPATPAFVAPSPVWAYPPSAAATLQGVRLMIQPAGAEVAFPDRPEAIVGRADAASQFSPDVDLDRFEALSNGVSRRHAKVMTRGGQVMIEDLDTANGTALNRQRLTPRQAHPLHDGDEVRFGKLVATVRLP